LFALASIAVLPVLLMVAVTQPHNTGWLLLVALIWFASGVPAAYKAAAILPTFTSNGETEAPSKGMQMMSGVGNLIAVVGIAMLQPGMVVSGLVLNAVFAFAMWRNLQHRVDYLFDADALPVDPPPTALSALTAVVGYMEAMVVFTALLAFANRDIGNSLNSLIAACLSGVLVCTLVWRWQRRVGLSFIGMLAPGGFSSRTLMWSVGSIVIGVALGALAHGYTELAMSWMSEENRNTMMAARESLRLATNEVAWLTVLAVVVAPLTEEFLFRGLLFRALSTRLPMWIAVLASAACFAVVHPMLSWIPVFVLGVVCALVFWRSRNLLPVILLHASYNAVVVMATF
jgi:membrane protease YdiL (CAAX protease family)